MNLTELKLDLRKWSLGLGKWSPLLALVVTAHTIQAKASRCQQALNQRQGLELSQNVNLTGVADIQIIENRVQVVLKEGNWSQRTLPSVENRTPSPEGKVENAFLLKALLQEQSTLPEFQRALSNPDGYVEIDLSAVKRISSDVLGTLLMFQKFLLLSYPQPMIPNAAEGNRGERLRLTGVQPDVYSFLRMAAMDKVLSISLVPSKP